MAWSKSLRISIMIAIDTAFFVLELGTGIYVGSLALMADAFHMLNDIISLVVGLWAVKAAQKQSTDKFSFGWLRAEILGAFFNAVFLIALCVSILLEAITRFIEVPEVKNPRLILIVGCLGLASNLAGFFVLGGHGHSHGPEGHSHDEHSAAEEGHSHVHEGHDHIHAEETGEEELASSVFAENVVAKAQAKAGQHIRFISEESSNGSKDVTHTPGRSTSKTSRKHHRRASSTRSGRYSNLEDLSIHPTSFRQNIIAASRSPVDGSESEDNTITDEEAVADENLPTENSPLLNKSNGNGSHSHKDGDHDHGHEHGHHRRHSSDLRSKTIACHKSHNHNKPKKPPKSGHGHSHGDTGMNGMILHVIGDALGNVGVIVSALIIWLTTWSGRYYADPAVSLFITIIILKSAVPLTSATAKILLQATPDHIDVQDIKEDILDIDGVLSCHHVHIWQLSDAQLIASMHIQVSFPISEASGERYMELAKAARQCLHAYGIHSATIQPEFCTDKAHDHTEGVLLGLDGIVGQARCRLDDDQCFLECIDNCAAKKCCDTSTVASESDHEGHGHGHSHRH